MKAKTFDELTEAERLYVTSVTHKLAAPNERQALALALLRRAYSLLRQDVLQSASPLPSGQTEIRVCAGCGEEFALTPEQADW